MIFDFISNLFNNSSTKNISSKIDDITSSVEKYKDATNVAENATITFGTTIKSAFASTLITAGIGVAISLIAKGVDYIVNYNKRLKELGEEANKIIEEVNDNYKSHANTVNELKIKYAELAQGVNQITGERTTLSSEEYQEFLDISNQLSEVFPQLYKGANDNGDAFLKLSGDTDTIVESLDALIEKEREIANIEIIKNIPSVVNGVKAAVNQYDEDVKQLESDYKRNVNTYINESFEKNGFDALFTKSSENGYYQQDENGNFEVRTKFSVFDSNDIEKYEKKLKELGIEAQRVSDGLYGLEYIFDTNLINNDATLYEIKNEIANQQKTYEQNLNALENDLKQSYNTINTSVQAWVEQNPAYQKLSPFQDIIDSMVAGIAFNKIDLDTDAIYDYITNNIINPLQKVSPEVQEQFVNMFDMKQKFANGEISQDEFISYINKAFNDLIISMGDSGEEFKMLFVNTFQNIGVDGDTFSSVVSNIIKSWNLQVKAKSGDIDVFGDSYKEEIDDYKDDLSALANWQEEYIKNGFLSSSSIYDLKNRFKNIIDLSDFDGTNYDNLFERIKESIISKILDPLKELLNSDDISDVLKSKLQLVITLIEGMANETMVSLDNLSAYSSAIDDVQNAYNTVADAIEEYNDQQYLSMDTAQSLLNLDDKYISILFDENGQLQLNKQSYQELVKAKLLDMYATIEKDSIDVVNTIKNETRAISNLTDEVDDMADANWDSVSSIFARGRAEIIASEQNPILLNMKLRELTNAENAAASRVKILKSTYANIGKNIDRIFRSSSRSTSTKTKEVQKFSESIDWLNNSINNLNLSISKLNLALDDNTLNFQKREDNINALIKAQEELISIEKEAVDVYKDEYNASIKAIGANKDTYKKKIESETKKYTIQDFTSESKYNLVKAAQEAWELYKEQKNKYNEAVLQLQNLNQQEFENEISYYTNLITRYENGKQDAQGKIDLKKANGTTIKDEDYQKIIDKNLSLIEHNKKIEEKLLNEKAKYSKQSDMYIELDNELQNVQNSIYQLRQEQIELNREILKLPIQKLEKQSKILEEQLDLIQENEKALSSSINAASNYLDKQFDYYEDLTDATNNSYDSQIEKIQEKIDLLNETNSEMKQHIELEKAQYELDKATQNKNVKIYRENIGFVYEADQDAIRDAKENLDEILFNKQINSYENEIKQLEEAKEKEIEFINKQSESLTQYKELLDDITSSYEETYNLEQLVKQFGSDVIARLNTGDLTLIEEIRNKYIDIQNEKTNTELQIENITANIEEINKLADSWTESSGTIEKSKIKIEKIVSDNSKEIAAIQSRTDAIKELSKQWAENEISIKENLGLINTNYSDAAIEENDILNNRLDNIKQFSVQSREYLETVSEKLNNIGSATVVTTTSYSSNNTQDNNILKKHSGMKTGFVGENYTSSDKERFRYISLNELKSDEVPAILQLGESVLTSNQQGIILNNMKNAFISGTQQLSAIPKNYSNVSNTISFNGDIVIEKVNGNVDEFAKKIKSDFLLRLEQQLFNN